MRTRSRNAVRYGCAVAIMAAITLNGLGCTPHYGMVLPTEEWPKTTIRTIALFAVSPPEDESKNVLKSGYLAPEAMTHVLTQVGKVLQEKGYPVQIGDFSTTVPQPVLAEWVVQTGSHLGTDAVFLVTPLRYENRDGGPAGVRKPASVAFELRIYRTLDGKFVWQGWYAETQRSLTENLGAFSLFLKRGGRWLSADELVYEGASELLQSFPRIASGP